MKLKNKFISLAKSSLIGKIILAFTLGTIAFVALMFFTNKYFIMEIVAPTVNNNNVNYTKLLVENFDSITDTTYLQKISTKKNIYIAVKNDTLLWKSDNEHDLVELDELRKVKGENNIWSGFEKGHNVVYKFGNTYLYFALERKWEGFSYFKEIIITINLSLFIIIIYLLFMLIRNILKPVDKLIDGVKKVSEGKFEHTIETTRTDELGTLIHSYNDMSHQVSNMIKSKEQLLLDVSHEMRSPLTRMKLGLEFIENEKAKKNILEDVNDLDKMITELLESERMNSVYGGLNKSEMNFNHLINEVMLQYSDVELNIGSKEIELNADKERLRLLFKNLIENALKYSENSGEPVAVEVVDNKNNVEIYIQDKGEGIPQDQLEFIFEPFYRVDKSRTKESGGFGLGLHLCKNIVEAHKGEISAQSKIGKGTTFKIVLPRN
jgi:signal transduction histidine kinase